MADLMKMAEVLPAEERDRIVDEGVKAVARDGVLTIAGLFKKPGEEGYNADASVPWSECSTKTRASLLIFKEVSQNRRMQHETERALGLVILKDKLDSDEWENEAARVDKESAKRTAIEVAAVEVKR